MARTKPQITNEILAEIANQPDLANLNSTSRTSIWRLFVDTVASSLTVNEQLWDVKQTELEKIADEAVPGTAAWLQRNVKKFQYGDQIQVNSNYTVSYPTVDASKQIVTQCSVKQIEGTREVLVKVAKGNSVLEPLSQSEKDALKSYIEKIQFAGTYITTISLQPDLLIANIDIYFDAEYVQAEVKANVIEAINTFLKQLKFDGVLSLNRFRDAIEFLPGVKDVMINGLIARPNITPRTDPSVQPFEREYETDAGYIVAETAPGYTLQDTINMIPN